MATINEIKERNDRLRKTLTPDRTHKVYMSAGVSELDNKEEVLEAIRNFDSFSGDNDPYGEHDFGMVIVNEEKYYFKIDYYDLNFEYGADHHNEEYACVLTIMHSSEY